MVLGRKGNDDTGVCPTAYQAARPPGLEPQGDIAETRRIAHDRGQVRQPRGLLSQAPWLGACRAGRWSTWGIRPSWTGGRPRICACPSSSATPRRACTSGSWRSAGSRARIRRCGAGSSVGGGSIAWSRTASPSWSGHREARRSISARPGPWSPESNAWCISWW